MAEFVVVLMTAPADRADSLAQALVERRLAACVNVVPGRSVYRWQGAVERRDEAVLIAKTRAIVVDSLTTALRELHPDANFELVALPIENGNPAYLSWIAESVDLPDDESVYFH